MASADLKPETIVWNVAPGTVPEVLATTAHVEGDPSVGAFFTGDASVVSVSATELAWIDIDSDSAQKTRSVTVAEDPATESYIVSPDGRLVAVSRQDQATEILDAMTLEVVATLPDSDFPIAFDNAASMLVTSGIGPKNPGSVHDVATGQETIELSIDSDDQSINWADFDLDGRLLAVGFNDAVVELWELETRRLLASLEHVGFITAVQFSADGRRLATADLSGSVKAWDVAGIRSGRQEDSWLIREVGFPTGHALAVGFTPDGDLFASGFNESVTVWDLATGAQLYDVGVGGPAWSVDFNPSGTRMLVPGPAGMIAIYSMDTLELTRIARAHIVRDFTPEECARFEIERCQL